MLLIPKTATATVVALKAAIAEIKKEMFPGGKKPAPPGFHDPLRDGDTATKKNGQSYGPTAAGHYVLNANAYEDRPPAVVGTERGPDGKLLPITSGVKSGDYGRAGITLYGYTKGDSGIGVGLRTLQRVFVGEALGADADPDVDFGGYNDEPDVL